MGASFEKQKKARGAKLDIGRFIALPYSVLESKEYRNLNYAARGLLIDLALQSSGDNNGKLVLCAKAMKPYGWAANDTLHRATVELLDSGLIVKTRQGRRPNVASWYALSWHNLHIKAGLDIDPSKYRRGVYTLCSKIAAKKIAPRYPINGVAAPSIAPTIGVKTSLPTPTIGAVVSQNHAPPTPIIGDYLEKPSVCVKSTSFNQAIEQVAGANENAQ